MSLDHARTYLTRVLPWTEGSYVNIHWTVPNKRFDAALPPKGKNKPQFMNGRAVVNVEEALNQVAYLTTRSDTLDIYVCMSSQREANKAQMKGGRSAGRQYLEALRGVSNVANLRALYLDLDVKPTGYATRADALKAFQDFLLKSGLPAPTVFVSSGTGGMHIYWVMDRNLTLDEWQPMANALAEATRRCGFTVDTQCTVDSTRLLRVPGTTNSKTTPRSPVELAANHVAPGNHTVDALRTALMPYTGATVLTLPRSSDPFSVLQQKAPLNGKGSTLGAGITSTPKTIDLTSVAPHCGFIREALDTGGQAFDQPQWNLATLIATFAVGGDGTDGREMAHRMARGHKDYDKLDTDALYDRKVLERETRNIGWPSCASIENANCKHCATCVRKPLAKSPLSSGHAYVAPVVQPQQFSAAPPLPGPVTPGGQPQQPATPGDPVPVGYRRDPVTRLLHRIGTNPQDGSPTMVPVSDALLYDFWIERNPYRLHFTARQPGQTDEDQVVITFDRLQSKEWAKHLAGQGIVVKGVHEKELRECLLSFVGMLRQIKGAVIDTEPYGWVVKNGKIEGFAYNGRLWGNGFDKPSAASNPVIEQTYRVVGDDQPWRDAVNFITAQRRPSINAIIATAFAAPLIRFTGKEGTVVSAFSAASGVGKTAAQEVAAAVWGSPKMSRRGLNDTVNSTQGVMAATRSLPTYWDELKDRTATERFVKMAFDVSRGVGKARMNSNAELRSQGDWQTILQVNSNESLMDAVARYVKASDAGILRVLEFNVSAAGMGQHPYGMVDRMVAKCHDHFGHAGLAYAKFLGEKHERVAKEVAHYQEHIGKLLCAPNDERFWVAAITCMIMGAKYANELGLTNIDVNQLIGFMGETIKGLRTAHRVQSVTNMDDKQALSSVLMQFVNLHRARNMVITNRVPVSQGAPPAGTIKVLNDLTRVEQPLMRYAEEQKILLVHRQAFNEWLQSKEISPRAVLDALKAKFNVQETVRNILSGVDEWRGPKSTERLILIDFSDATMAEVQEAEAAVKGGTP